MLLTGASCFAKSGAMTPSATPAAIPMKIHAVIDRRRVFISVLPI